jgi:peptidoglycan/LPS O-acetylase OafA/YrhL
MSKKTTPLKYRPEIDGLRTLAVIPVILFHMSHNLLKGGYYGVDVFFVISGYLITKIITDKIENGNFSMYQFWIRRVKRLLPLLLTVALATLIVAILFLFKPTIKDIVKDFFPAIFSYFNFHALYNFGDYWGGRSEQSFFLHTWSLSIEEQFYLIYPLFLFLSYRYFKGFILSISIVTIISFVLFVFFLSTNKDFTFYLLPTRIWELSLGGLAGLLTLKNIKISKYQNILPIIGVLLISFSYLFGHNTISLLVILPVIGTILIILFCTEKDIIGKILSTNLFVFLGKISYSLYLWHWGIIVLLKYNLRYLLSDTSNIIVGGIIVVLTFLLAYLSHIYVENKTRNYKHTPKIVLVGFILISGLTFYYQSDLFSPYYDSSYNNQTAYFNYYNINPKPNKTDTTLAFYHNISQQSRLEKFNDCYKKEGIITNDKNGKPKIILIGDSHGVMWAKLIDEIAEEAHITLSCYTTSGEPPFFDIENINSQEKTKSFSKEQRIEYAKSMINNIEKWKPKVIALVCRWESFFMRNNSKQQLNEFLSFLESKKIKVLLFTQPPMLNYIPDRTNTAQYFTYLGIPPTKGYNLIKNIDNSSIIKGNEYLKKLTTKYHNIVIYDVYHHMLVDNKIKISLGKNVLYYDDDHLSYYGTYEHKENILQMFNSIIDDGKTE